MTDASPPSPRTQDPVGADPLPKHTTPTWEVELLISGVMVFAMVQLPGWLDDRYFDLYSRFSPDWRLVLFPCYLYLRITALILAITFVLHLLLRAHWIALVGLDSVYPEGIRWDRTRMGPLAREIARRRLGSFADAIERADNLATIVFAAGVQMALLTLKMVAIIAAIAAVFIAIGLFVALPQGGMLVMATIVVLVVPFALARIIDQRFGERLAPDGAFARTIAGIIRNYARIGLGYEGQPGGLMLSSNRGYRSSAAIFVAVMTLTFGLTLFQVNTGDEPFAIGDYGLLPEARRDTGDVLRADHYDDQRDGARPATMPYIPSQVVSESWLRLTIPIDPAVHDAALQRYCPALVHPSTADPLQRRALLDCFAAIHPLQLDGHPVAGLRYDLGSDARAHRPALVAMIDVRALANGRHELGVGAPKNADGKSGVSDRIPFWR